ncbi:MAG TPA: glycosyltransferase [Spirochaetota bacterium]|nr:glycosyltransferase [Spirochaetota bacterium]
MHLFSVIIPVYNRPVPLRRAIESVLAQSFRDYEIIVVDDGSTDHTGTAARSFPAVRYFRQERRGVSAARNRGAAESRARYLAFLDSDDEWLPGKLGAQREFIERNPLVRIHQTDETWIRRGIRVNPMKKHRKPEGDIFIPSLDLCLVSPSAVAIERSLFDRVGGFDERLEVCEDYDLWLRIALDERVGLVDRKLVVKHGGHDDQLSRRHWGMDRFRVYAIMKLLRERADDMASPRRDAAREAARSRCVILAQGARKRGNNKLAVILESVMRAIDDEDYSNTAFESLAEA